MLTADNVRNYIGDIKRHLNITWSDADTDARLIDKMRDAEVALNHKLGATVDYFTPGAERELYRNYMIYSWNDCANEFDAAYRAEIIQLRHKYEIAAYKASKEGTPDEEEE